MNHFSPPKRRYDNTSPSEQPYLIDSQGAPQEVPDQQRDNPSTIGPAHRWTNLLGAGTAFSLFFFSHLWPMKTSYSATAGEAKQPASHGLFELHAPDFARASNTEDPPEVALCGLRRAMQRCVSSSSLLTREGCTQSLGFTTYTSVTLCSTAANLPGLRQTTCTPIHPGFTPVERPATRPAVTPTDRSHFAGVTPRELASDCPTSTPTVPYADRLAFASQYDFRHAQHLARQLAHHLLVPLARFLSHQHPRLTPKIPTSNSPAPRLPAPQLGPNAPTSNSPQLLSHRPAQLAPNASTSNLLQLLGCRRTQLTPNAPTPNLSAPQSPTPRFTPNASTSDSPGFLGQAIWSPIRRLLRARD